MPYAFTGGGAWVADTAADLGVSSIQLSSAGLALKANAGSYAYSVGNLGTTSTGYTVSVSGTGQLTLNPGIYIIKGGGFSVSGGARVTGNGVLIYNAGSNFPGTGGTFGQVVLSGNGNISLTPMTTGTASLA